MQSSFDAPPTSRPTPCPHPRLGGPGVPGRPDLDAPLAASTFIYVVIPRAATVTITRRGRLVTVRAWRVEHLLRTPPAHPAFGNESDQDTRVGL